MGGSEGRVEIMEEIRVVLLPEKTGLFTSWDALNSTIKTRGIDRIISFDNEVRAKRAIRAYYSPERLFLMDIDDTGDMRKNHMYELPSSCIGKFEETDKKKSEEEWENGEK
ncbi:MAG: hypothetical protein LBT06_04105 [Hungatella sp.]|jgi:hypothetical protein|nr:hypothetical protein [Hungatella sp.]